MKPNFMTRSPVKMLLGTVLFLLCVFSAVRGAVNAKQTAYFVKNGMLMEAPVTGMAYTWFTSYPAVSYTVDGVTYTDVNTFYNGYEVMNVGDMLLLYYDPADPGKVLLASNLYFTATVWLCIAGVSFVLVILLAAGILRRENQRRTLRKAGETVQAQVIDANLISTPNFYPKKPYRITCTYVEETHGHKYYFTAENIWFDPKPHLNGSLPVKLLPAEKKAKLGEEAYYAWYYVDLTALLAAKYGEETK